ncbi:hypothetical protein H072_5013 [Dactylellina haptotyla CBS 200.50]|uniref:NAD(P)-binding protein n=1 Tax=Dactylellina haptotyla (strain CBS 200.50) TaxID=1284197 RepID=S8C0G0_DACHA|nr:hypothetical protein H072_5013 [Dactylellina haptotyla CBS 200.50]
MDASSQSTSPQPVGNSGLASDHATSTAPTAGLPVSAGPVNKDEPIAQLVWLIFGATGHLGRTVSGIALAKNDRVIQVGKTGADEDNPPPSHPNSFFTVCDIRERESVSNVIDRALAVWGRLDVVVNCAGYGVIGACEDQDDYEIRNQMDTNFMGLFHIMHLTVPYFRKRKGGRYIIFSSTSGFLGLPGLGGYCGSKWAVEGFIESLMYELEPFNVKVSLVIAGLAKRDEPTQDTHGAIPNWAHFLITTPSASYSNVASPANHARRMVQWIRDKQITSGLKVAEMVWELAHCQKPPLRLLLGQHAVESMRDRLRFTLEEIEDWKHLYHIDDADVQNQNEGQDGVDSGEMEDVLMSTREEDDDSK